MKESFIFLFIVIIIFVCNSYTHSQVYKVYIELSVSSFNYITYLPIVVRAWNKIGYCTIVIIVFHFLNNNIITIKTILEKIGSEVILFKINTTLSLHYSSKLLRIFGFLLSKKVKNNDFLYLSDADMIPISKSFFNDLCYNKLVIKSFGPNGYGFGNNKGRWAMCYMVANKYIWRSILDNNILFNNISRILENILKLEIDKGERYFENFAFIDEVYIRDKIKEWKYFNSLVIFHKRNYHKTRIDRINWPNNIFSINKSNIIDIHLPKLPYQKQELLDIWMKKIIPLQDYLFNSTFYDLNYVRMLIDSFNKSRILWNLDQKMN